MRRPTVCLLILYPFFSTSTVGQTTADDFLKSANDDRRNGQLDAVIADCDKAIELDPSNGLAYLYRGHAHFTQRHWKEAIADFRKACDLSPTRFEDTRLLIWAARACMGEKRAASAELAEYFDKKVTATERSIASPIPTLAPNSFDAAVATLETGPPRKNWSLRTEIREEWLPVIAKFLRGKISEKEFFRKDPPPRGVPAHSWAVRRPGTQSSEAWFFAGLKRVVDGDKKNAAEYFRKCSTAPGKYELERELAEAELKAIRAK